MILSRGHHLAHRLSGQWGPVQPIEKKFGSVRYGPWAGPTCLKPSSVHRPSSFEPTKAQSDPPIKARPISSYLIILYNFIELISLHKIFWERPSPMREKPNPITTSIKIKIKNILLCFNCNPSRTTTICLIHLISPSLSLSLIHCSY